MLTKYVAWGRSSRLLYLVEAAEAQDSVVELAGLQELLRSVLDVHEGHLRVLLAVEDREEDVALDAHGLQRPQGNTHLGGELRDTPPKLLPPTMAPHQGHTYNLFP